MSDSETESEAESSSTDSAGGPVRILRTVTPDFIRRSYVLKFGIVLILLGLAVGAVGFVGSEQLKGEFQNEVNEKFETLAQQEANSLRDWNANNIETIRLYSRQPVVQGGTPEEISQYFRAERDGNQWGTQRGSPHLYLVDKNSGDVLSTTNSLVNNINQINESLMDPIQNAGGTITRAPAYVNTDMDGGQVEIAYVTNVDRDSGPDRTLVFTVPVASVAGSLGGGGVFAESDSQGVALVVNGQSQIVFEQYNNREQYLKPYPDESALENARNLQESVAGSEVSGPGEGALGDVDIYELSGRDYVVGYSRVPPAAGTGGGGAGSGDNPDWVVMIHINTVDAYGEVQSVADQALIATGIGVLLIGVFGAVLGRNTGRAIDRLTGKAEEMEEGNLEVDLESGRIDNIGRLYDGFDNMRTALKQQIQEAESARKEAEVSRAEAMEMSNYLQETADEYAEIMQQCGAGDLTKRMEAEGENEAMDRIANEFNDMIDELEKTTGQLKSFSEEVETAGDVVKNSSESVRDASEQVADSVQKISDDAYEQKERLQEISETIDDIAADLETFSQEHDVDFGDSLDRIEEVANMLSSVVDLSEETMAEAENVAGAAEEQAAELNEVTQRAEDLSRYARPLREVLDRFETESEHEFYFPTGPGSGEGTMPGEGDDE